MSQHCIDSIIEKLPEAASSEPALQTPKKYKVLLINDDYTPMEFVIDVLIRFFRLSKEAATQVMLEVHTRGKGICGVYTRDIAETKVAQVKDYAYRNQHPLLCGMEPEI